MMGPLSGTDIEVHTDKHCVGLVHGEKESIESQAVLNHYFLLPKAPHCRKLLGWIRKNQMKNLKALF